MTCNDARERLPEHLLGTIEEVEDLEVRRHLRACSGCRAELAALGEGLSQFARASHDRPPPDELRGRVLGILAEEWRDVPVTPPGNRSFRWIAWVGVAATFVAVASWGAVQSHRADTVASTASSYTRLLDALGGKDFRVGTLHAAGPQLIEGSVVLYDSQGDQSWGLVLVRAPGMIGNATPTLSSSDGQMIRMLPLKFSNEGDASSWLVTYKKLKGFDHLTVTSSDGTVVATASLHMA